MVNVKTQAPSVSVTLADGETTTVPTGETWRVSALGFSITTVLIINGYRVQLFDDDQEAAGGGIGQFVLDSGDTIECTTDATNSGGAIHISGFEVSSSVDNTPISKTGNTTTFTVPTGETWRLNAIGFAQESAAAHSLRINNELVQRFEDNNTNNGYTQQFIVSGDDTVEVSGTGTSGGVHISGFKVN